VTPEVEKVKQSLSKGIPTLEEQTVAFYKSTPYA